MSGRANSGGGALVHRLQDWRSRNPEAAEAASRFDPSTARQRSTWPIALEQIRIGPRLREVDDEAVARLAESMDRIGLQNPIQVRHNFGIDPNTGEYDRSLDQGGFALVAGRHRIEAAKKLGWGRIEAFVLDDPSPDELALVEVDENLVRSELTPLHRGRFAARRKELHRRLRLTARKGGDRRSPEYRENQLSENQTFDFPAAPGFLEETAEATGLARSTLARAVRIGERIVPELQDALEETPIARREGDLHRIAGLSPGQQQRLLERVREADEPPATLSALQQDRDAPPRPPAAPDRARLFERLESAWSQIAPQDRITALRRLCLLIDRQQRNELVEALRARPDAGAASPEEEPT